MAPRSALEARPWNVETCPRTDGQRLATRAAVVAVAEVVGEGVAVGDQTPSIRTGRRPDCVDPPAGTSEPRWHAGDATAPRPASHRATPAPGRRGWPAGARYDKHEIGDAVMAGSPGRRLSCSVEGHRGNGWRPHRAAATRTRRPAATAARRSPAGSSDRRGIARAIDAASEHEVLAAHAGVGPTPCTEAIVEPGLGQAPRVVRRPVVLGGAIQQ